MLYYVLVFLILALIAGALGFSGVQFMSIEIARVLFFIFIVLFLVSLVMSLLGRGKGPRV